LGGTIDTYLLYIFVGIFSSLIIVVPAILSRRVQEISGYRVVGFIGRGGYADVYRARDKSGREVALKLYRGDDKAFVDEVGRVVGLANRLGIPYIVKILDYGVNPRPFIVMELYPTNLRELIRRGISPDDGLKLMRRVGVALAYAHRMGVFHGDLKPENILVYEEEGELYPAIADWGGGFTPGYSAPEVYLSKGKDLRAESDVWSFGAVLYEILSGKKLFKDPIEYIKYVRTGSGVHVDLYGGLKDLVEECLARDPGKRPSMAEVVRRLSRHIHDNISLRVSSKSEKSEITVEDALNLISSYIYNEDLIEAMEKVKDASSEKILPQEIALIYYRVFDLYRLLLDYRGRSIPTKEIELIYESILETVDEELRKKLEQSKYSLKNLLQIGEEISPNLYDALRISVEWMIETIKNYYLIKALKKSS